MDSRTTMISRQWHEGKVHPLQGNSPHDRPVSRGIFSLKENLRRSLRCHWLPAPNKIPRRLDMRFLRHGGIYRSDVVQPKPNPGTGTDCLPPVGPATQVKERVGRTTPFSSSAMSSGRLFLEQVGRHQSLSPLHRRPQNNTHPEQHPGKDDISTLLRGRHFYFALTHFYFALTTCGQADRIPANSVFACIGLCRMRAVPERGFGERRTDICRFESLN
jgi:hypothetical protein